MRQMIPHRVKLTIIFLLLALALVILTVPILLWVSLKYIEPINVEYGPLIEDPELGFTQFTGLEWPQNAEVITFADTHGGFLGDGEFYVVFSADQAMLDEWLSNPPPWGIEAWKSGPVPPEIGFHATFGIDSVVIEGDGSDAQYISEGGLVSLLASDHVWYVAKERCCDHDEDFYFHNGELLIIDLDMQRVWFSSWDF